jgi:hypothetical protein
MIDWIDSDKIIQEEIDRLRAERAILRELVREANNIDDPYIFTDEWRYTAKQLLEKP